MKNTKGNKLDQPRISLSVVQIILKGLMGLVSESSGVCFIPQVAVWGGGVMWAVGVSQGLHWTKIVMSHMQFIFRRCFEAECSLTAGQHL